MIALWTAPQGGAWTRLPGPVTAWSILRTDRLGKDSFRVELADAALPDGRLRISARVDGVGWFTGLADEVLRMAQRYKKPSLCNAYCARACPIGQEYVPEIKPKELPAIVLEMLATLNTLDRERGCLIDISADGSIDPDELADFLRIQRELEQISRTVEALQLWAEKMMADGRIDRAAYTREISAAGEK